MVKHEVVAGEGQADFLEVWRIVGLFRDFYKSAGEVIDFADIAKLAVEVVGVSA